MKQILALLLAAGHAVSAGAADFAWQWPLDLSEADQPAYRVDLPVEVYASLFDNMLRDVEVLDASGRRMPASMESVGRRLAPAVALEQVPWFLLGDGEVVSTQRIETILRTPELQLEYRRPEATAAPAAVIVDLGEQPGGAVALIVEPPATDSPWQARIVVETSGDLQGWRPLGPPHDLYRLRQGGHELRALRIPLAATPARFLRLGYPDPGRRDRLVDLQIERRASDAIELPALRWLELDGEAGKDGPAWLFELPGPLRVEQWRVGFEQPIWLGRARLASRRDGKAAWRVRGETTAYRWLLDGLELRDSALPMEPGRDRHWQLDWEGGAPAPPRLALAYRPDRLVFVAEGEAPYRLVAGSGALRRIDAPTAALFAAIRAQRGQAWEPPAAVPGPRSELAGAAALRAPSDRERWSRLLLWGILLGVAASVVTMAVRLLRGSEKSGSSP